MINKDLLLTVINDQQKNSWDVEKHVPRANDIPFDNKFIYIISGIRRCGKSTLLQEIRTKYETNNYFLNFDDDRLIKFTVEDFQLLLELFIGEFGEQKVVFFDEIQNIDGWERFIRRLHDNGYKIFITGSNARMLSKELGTHLTGRYIQKELFPFSFKTYLSYKGIKTNIHETTNKAIILKEYSRYFQIGGIPDYIRTENKEYLKELYSSILYRDILMRNNLLNEKQMKDLIYYIASNVGKEITYSSLAKTINVKHTDTVKDYLNVIQSTYLIFIINQYSVSLRKQIYNPKKVYMIDNALCFALGFRHSEDSGRLLENLVFIELLRRKKEVYYHKNKKECDFLIREGIIITDAIQVTYSLSNHETKQRELNGLLEAMEDYNLSNGTIITDDEQDEIEVHGKLIYVVPVWKWLLGGLED
jgi:uncharacterized protein